MLAVFSRRLIGSFVKIPAARFCQMKANHPDPIENDVMTHIILDLRS